MRQGRIGLEVMTLLMILFSSDGACSRVGTDLHVFGTHDLNTLSGVNYQTCFGLGELAHAIMTLLDISL